MAMTHKSKIASGLYRVESSTAMHAIIERNIDGVWVTYNMRGVSIEGHHTLREAYESVAYAVENDFSDFPAYAPPCYRHSCGLIFWLMIQSRSGRIGCFRARQDGTPTKYCKREGTVRQHSPPPLATNST